MKKIILGLMAVMLVASVAMGQYKTKKLIVPIENRASAIGTYVKQGDFIFIIADSAIYMSKTSFGPATTGTQFLASASNYAVGKLAAGVVALTATTGTFSSTLGVAGNFAINTNKFNVTAASGNTTVAGTLGVTGNVAVNTNKFTVAASSGNTVIAGTAAVTGLATLSAGAVITADTTTAVVGKIVYVAADSSFYGCRSTSAAKKWYKLN